MRLKILVFGLLSAMLLVATQSGAQAAKPTSGSITQTVTGTFTDAVGGTGAFTGTLSATRFAAQGDQLIATGTVTGTLTDSLGNVLGTATTTFQAPVVAAQATCQILHLELGPLDLNLLGLMVHLDKVVLDITAQQAPGNLLGNLLCAIAHLLDGGNPLSDIAGLLNRILRLLG
jgi:hypothetical protein